MRTIIPTICTQCGKKTDVYYCKSVEWWTRYIKGDEELCLDCIKQREGFAEDFEKNVGISLDKYEVLLTIR